MASAILYKTTTYGNIGNRVQVFYSLIPSNPGELAEQDSGRSYELPEGYTIEITAEGSRFFDNKGNYCILTAGDTDDDPHLISLQGNVRLELTEYEQFTDLLHKHMREGITLDIK